MANPLVLYRSQRALSKADAGRALGYLKANPSRFFERLETGEIPADADMVARIVALTEGAVTAGDMHDIRLAWLKANRPEKFAEAAE
jgi:hypothetical protein